MPTLTSAQIQRYFKIAGKLILLSQEGQSIALNYRRLVVAVVDQGVSGDPAEFATVINLLNPFSAAMAGSVTAADGIKPSAIKYVGILIQQIIAVDAGLGAGTAADTVLTQLVADMTTASESVGHASGHPNGISQFFLDNFDTQLPESGSPTIPDTYITDTVL